MDYNVSTPSTFLREPPFGGALGLPLETEPPFGDALGLHQWISIRGGLPVAEHLAFFRRNLPSEMPSAFLQRRLWPARGETFTEPSFGGSLRMLSEDLIFCVPQTLLVSEEKGVTNGDKLFSAPSSRRKHRRL